MSPEHIDKIDDLRAILDRLRADGKRIGFVPTMGYLHDGHGSLMAAAARANDNVVTSIFVNPLQFAAGEDLTTYPRDLTGDTGVARAQRVDYLFVPSVEEMYPFGPVLTSISVAELSERWDGRSRPSHFAGVATVVAKLFGIVGPCRAYFGDKDFQQLAVVRRMTADLSIPVEVVGCPIVRESDGLAMSSRNVYLSPAERKAATVLRRALDDAAAAFESGVGDPARLVSVMESAVAAEPLARIDYAAVVDPATLMVPPRASVESRFLVAVHIGSTRLIDNCAASAPPALLHDGVAASEINPLGQRPTVDRKEPVDRPEEQS